MISIVVSLAVASGLLAAFLCSLRQRIKALEDTDGCWKQEMDDVVSALERWAPLRDSVPAAVNDLVSELSKARGRIELLEAAERARKDLTK